MASSVITLASQSHHFSIQNMSVSTYMDITNPLLLQTDFGAKNLQWTPASMYVHPPSSQLTSVNNVPAVSVTLMPSACRPLPGCGVLIALLIAVNVGQIPLLRQFTTAGANQSTFQLSSYAPWRKQSEASITLFDWTTVFMMTHSCVQLLHFYEFMAIWYTGVFPSLLVITYLAYNVLIFLDPRSTL